MSKSRFLVIGIVLTPGCEQAIPPEELGQVVYEVPMVSGAEEPYPIPELRTPIEGSSGDNQQEKQ